MNIYADYIYANGKIYTMDDKMTATSIAIKIPLQKVHLDKILKFYHF